MYLAMDPTNLSFHCNWKETIGSRWKVGLFSVKGSLLPVSLLPDHVRESRCFFLPSGMSEHSIVRKVVNSWSSAIFALLA
jgi:ABC-type uncharacterized transport system permease subunit